jgi:DNA-directed RNA polymerase II subunit RPB1
MELDADKMLEKNITMDDVHFAIANAYSDRVSCIYSDYNDNKLIFRIRVLNPTNSTAAKKAKGIDALDVSDDIYQLKTVQDLLLKKIVLRGVESISKVIPRKMQNMLVLQEGKYVSKDIWIMDTTGSNLLEVLGLAYIDYKRTYSNDIYEVFDVLGIEAARQVILNELTEVMEFAGVYINYAHLSVLADRMTYSKDMVAVYRSGILNDDIGVIAKASYEVHTEMLLNGAKHGLLDPMTGVSSNVMTGQMFLGGTNLCQVHLDLKEMERLNTRAELLQETTSATADIERQFAEVIEKDRASEDCSAANITIANYLGAMPAMKVESKCDEEDGYDMGF